MTFARGAYVRVAVVEVAVAEFAVRVAVSVGYKVRVLVSERDLVEVVFRTLVLVSPAEKDFALSRQEAAGTCGAQEKAAARMARIAMATLMEWYRCMARGLRVGY